MKKTSIKWKTTYLFIIVVVCCIGFILLFNTLFLERIYINSKVEILKKSYDALSNGIIESYNKGYDLSDLYRRSISKDDNSTDENSYVAFLRELQENYNISVVLMDQNNKTYSLFQNNNRFDRRIFEYIFKDIENDENFKVLEKNEKYTITIHTPINVPIQIKRGVQNGGPSDYYESKGPSEDVEHKNKRKNFSFSIKKNADLECFGILSDNSTAFYMTVPVASIKEPIALFNKVLIIISIFIILIGAIMIYIISNSLTKPLLQLVRISRKMSNLEFENRYEGNRADEIGVLGNSMNEMSKRLEQTIRELKNANVILKKDLEKKAELDKLRQEFVANVSHELKTPIALIQGYAEGLESNGIVNNEESKNYYISVIKDEAEKMNKMVHDLLDLSSLERGMEELNIERIPLFDVIDGMLKSQELNISEKGVNVINEVPKDTYIWIDEYKLENILRNYFTNALHYVDDNNIIKLYIETISETKIRFYVFNTGMQLSDEDRNRVWEKFYKVDKARTREYGGTGLGLSIVKAIAEQHNTICGCQNMEIDNKKGIAFYFDFAIK